MAAEKGMNSSEITVIMIWRYFIIQENIIYYYSFIITFINTIIIHLKNHYYYYFQINIININLIYFFIIIHFIKLNESGSERGSQLERESSGRSDLNRKLYEKSSTTN